MRLDFSTVQFHVVLNIHKANHLISCDIIDNCVTKSRNKLGRHEIQNLIVCNFVQNILFNW